MIGVRAGRAKLGHVTLADLIPTQDGEGVWDAALGSAIGQQHDADGGELFDLFSGWAADRGLPLYPHQEEALLEIVADANVIVGTPTGSGKSLIATAALFTGLATGRRSYYTAPIKALVSEKFFDLVDIFGASAVGMITGDSAVNAAAPIICCTAEILAGIALRGGNDSDAGIVVMDEFHYYGDPQRGWAWQVPLLELNRAQFVLMSATLGDMRFFADDLTKRTGRETAVIARTWNGRCRCTSRTPWCRSPRPCRTCWRPSGRRSTSCISPRRPPWNGRRHCPA